MKKLIAITLLLSMLVGLLGGCSVPGQTSAPAAPGAPSGADAPAAKPGPADAVSATGYLKVAQKEDPISLDPHVGNDTHTSTALLLGFEGLLNWKDGKIVPGMAEEYTISDDGTVYTFKLRDAKWSDGKAVTAQDFADTYIRMLTRKDAMDLAYLIFPIKNAQPVNTGEKDVSQLGVKVIDEKTLEITLEASLPFAAYLFTQSFTLPIRCDLAEQYGIDYGNSPDKMVYNGPYILKEWARGDKLVWVKNPDYWDAASITFDTIDLICVNDPNTRKNMYDAGEIHWMNLEPELIPTLKESHPDFKDYSNGGVRFIIFSQKGTSAEKAKILSNRNFVMAMSAVIDREDFIKAFNPVHIPSTGVIPPMVSDQMGGQWGDSYTVANQYHKLKADIPAAKAYMAKACEELGYKSAAEFPVFDFITQSGEEPKAFCEYFQNIWKEELGVRTEIRPLDFAQFWENLYNAPYDICRSGWGPDYDDPFTYLDMWDSRGGWNKTGWVGESYYKKITEANQQKDMKARNDMFFEAEKILLTEAPIIPIWVTGGGNLMSPKITGVSINKFGAIFDFRYAKFVE